MCERCEDINYSQPPLCFYKKILNNFSFKNIYIISIDNLNPIIEPLIKEFPKIIHTNNSIQRDIAILSNEYNNDFINKSLNITLYPYEDIVNNIYNINHSINSTSTVLNDDRYYFNLVSKLGFVDGNISLINNFIFPIDRLSKY